MKKQIAIITGMILLLLFLHQSAFAQEAKRFGAGTNIYGMKIGSTTIGNSDFNFDETASVGVNLTYCFNNFFSMELFVSQAKTNVTAEVEEFSGAMGEIKQIPLLLTGRVHFPINKGKNNFYLGAGVGYYLHEFDNIDRTRPAEFFAMNMELDIEDSMGGHFVVGGEFFIMENWVFNLDMKGIFNKTEFTLRNPATETEVRDVALNSYMAGIGVRYYFK